MLNLTEGVLTGIPYYYKTPNFDGNDYRVPHFNPHSREARDFYEQNIDNLEYKQEKVIPANVRERLNPHDLIENEWLTRDRKARAEIADLLDYERMRMLQGRNMLPIYAAAAAGLNAITGESMGNGLAMATGAVAAPLIADVAMNTTPLRKYKAIAGIRPAAALLGAVVGDFLVRKPEEEKLLQQGMAYAQQQSNQPIQ